MLNQMRSVAGNFAAKILLLLLILSFGIWGIGDMVNSPNRNAAVAKVGDMSITRIAYESALRQEVENIRRAFGSNYSPEMIAQMRLPQQVMQTLINRTLLKQESEVLGIAPSDTDIARRIRTDPAFADTKGSFDKELFATRLRAAGLSEKAYIDQQRLEIAIGLLMDSMSSIPPMPDAAVDVIYKILHEQRTATLYTLNPSAANISEPSPDMLEAYYKEHAGDFSTPEMRTLSYITFKNDVAGAKAKASEDELRAAYTERVEEFKHPERRSVEQLLYSTEDGAKKAAGLLKAGKTVGEIALSTDILNKKNTSLGKVERNNVIEAAAEEVFLLKEGEATGPIKSPFGWHIFHVSAIYPPQTSSFEEVRALLEKDVISHKSDEALTAFANQVEDALAGGSSLSEAAKDAGLSVHTLGPVTRDGKNKTGSVDNNIPDLEKFMETAFKLEEKTESMLTPSKGGSYYIVRADAVSPEHARPLEEVRSEVVAGWKKSERSKILAHIAEEAANKFKDPATRSAAIAQYGLSSSATGAISRDTNSDTVPSALAADIFANAPGESTDAHPVKNGNYVIAVTNDIIPATLPRKSDTGNAETDKLRKALGNNAQKEVVEQYIRYLESKHPVWIDESALKVLDKE